MFVIPRVVAVVARAFAVLPVVSEALRHLQAALAMAVLAAIPHHANPFPPDRARAFLQPQRSSLPPAYVLTHQ